MTDVVRKAVIALPIAGDENYMNGLNTLTDEERMIIAQRIPVPVDRADQIIDKVLDRRTVSDDVYMASVKKILRENADAIRELAE